MRTPSKITIKGFKAYLHQTVVQLSPGCWFLLGQNLDYPDAADSNGSGKTGILDAIFWCLYGRMIDGKKPSLAQVKHDQATKASVLLQFDDGAEVHREVGSKESLAYRFGPAQNWTEPDIREAQRQLDEQVMGINWTTCMATCVLSAGAASTQFLRADPADRAQLLGYLVDDLIFQRAAKHMKADQDAANQRFAMLVQHAEYLQRDLEAGQTDLTRLQAKLDQEQAALGQTRHALTKELEATSLQLQTLKGLIESPPPMQHNQQHTEGELAKMQQLLKSLNEDLLTAMVGAGSGLWKAGDQCPQCRRVVSPQEAARLAEKAQEKAQEVELLRSQIQLATTQQAELQTVLLGFSHYRSQVQGWQQSYTVLYERYLLLKDQRDKDPLVELKSRIKDLQDSLQGKGKTLESVRTEQRELAVKTDTLKTLIPGFSKDIRNIMFDQIRVELEELTRINTQLVAKGGMFTVLYPNTTNRNREKFEVQIMRNGKVRDLSTYSGGEAWRASCAVLFSLRRVMLNQSRSKVDFLLVDDPLGDLDETGRNKFFEVIGDLQKREGGLVMVTTPARTVPVVGDAKVLRVRMQNGVAGVQ